jgi:hypothetical protein
MTSRWNCWRAPSFPRAYVRLNSVRWHHIWPFERLGGRSPCGPARSILRSRPSRFSAPSAPGGAAESSVMFSLLDRALPSARAGGGTQLAAGFGPRSELQPVGTRAGWRTGAERAGAPRPLHGASPAPNPRKAPHPLSCALLLHRAGPRQEMRRGGSRREPALSPRRGGRRRVPPPYPSSTPALAQ